MSIATAAHESIQEYYGRVLQRSDHLKTDACCTPDDMPRHLRDIVRRIAAPVRERFYGCGSPIPPAIEGATVLDLGCGTGRDSFVCAALAGPHGRAIGVDMTEAQLEVARAHEAEQAEAFGFDSPNTAFHCGYMEDLAAVGIADESVDVVISNCVINLAPDKHRVFSEILRVLKPGGELYFSDIFADRRLPAAWRDDQVLLGECLAGAMYLEDFRRMLSGLGVPDYRVCARRPVSIANEDVETKVGATRFESLTIRAFKLASLEDRCEDFGQVATYLGTILNAPHVFTLDDHHDFFAHKPTLVCGNSAAMVEETRLGAHFEVTPPTGHFGLFPCDPAPASSSDQGLCADGCC